VTPCEPLVETLQYAKEGFVGFWQNLSQPRGFALVLNKVELRVCSDSRSMDMDLDIFPFMVVMRISRKFGKCDWQ
jgi:hypothetical protein